MSKQQSFIEGLWTGWAIGTLLMLIPMIVLAVNR